VQEWASPGLGTGRRAREEDVEPVEEALATSRREVADGSVGRRVERCRRRGPLGGEGDVACRGVGEDGTGKSKKKKMTCGTYMSVSVEGGVEYGC
jgi:hypothetical protein